MLQRHKENDKEYLIGYHTQEHRGKDFLRLPIKCKASNAWLGIGYYFWVDLRYAEYWGEDFKIKNTGYYDVYKSYLNDGNFINASFSEEGYFFFKNKIESTIEFLKNKGVKVTLQKVHRFLAEEVWPKLDITGIIYDDLPHNVPEKNRIYSEVKPLYYQKRVQIVVFNESNFNTFVPYLKRKTKK